MKMTLACAVALSILTLTACGPKPQGGEATPAVDSPGAAPQAVTVTGSQAGGTFRASNTAEEGDFTVPFYPGAQMVSGGRHEATDSAGQTTTTAAAELRTKDSIDQVVEFYATRVEGGNRVDTSIEGRRTVVLAPAGPSSGTSVTVTQEDGTTRITLVNQGG